MEQIMFYNPVKIIEYVFMILIHSFNMRLLYNYKHLHKALRSDLKDFQMKP